MSPIPPRRYATSFFHIYRAAASSLRVLGLFAGLIGVAAVCAWVVHRALQTLVSARSSPPPDLLGRLGASLRRFLADLAALAVFVLVGWLGLGQVLPVDDFAHEVGVRVLDGIGRTALYLIGARFLLSPDDAFGRVLPLPHPHWHFGMLMAYGVFGSFVGQTVMLAQRIGSNPVAIEGWFLLAATLITLLKFWWFWGGRRDIGSLFLADGNGRGGGFLRRAAAGAMPWLLIAAAVLIWAVGAIAAVAPQAAHWGAAAGITQLLVIVVPLTAMGVSALAENLIARRLGDPALSPLRAASAAVGRTLVAAGVWVLGIYVIARVWNLFLVDPRSASTLVAIGTAVRISAALVLGWVMWSFLRAYLRVFSSTPASRRPADAGTHLPAAPSRLTTVLPLIRNVAFGAIVAITALLFLSALGVEVGPLLAALGVVGLAISFGSQALVRDIVSGVFFMADDAFRIGEYIEVGEAKGTVEKITLRSLHLRHHRGPIHVLPYGEIKQLKNTSRDWMIVTMEFRLADDTDVEKVRRIVKRIGQEIAADPELGRDLLEPLKSQGVMGTEDSALVVRTKFMARPGDGPWIIRREAYTRMLKAFREEGIKLARRHVTVVVPEGNATPAVAAAGAAAVGASGERSGRPTG